MRAINLFLLNALVINLDVLIAFVDHMVIPYNLFTFIINHI